MRLLPTLLLYSALTIAATGCASAPGVNPGKVSSSANTMSVETAMRYIQREGSKTGLSTLGVFFDRDTKGYDGRVSVNQEGDIFVQKELSPDLASAKYGPKMKIGNLFEGRDHIGYILVHELYSIDLNQDGLHDLVFKVADVTGEEGNKPISRSTLDFYFATGNGEFSKGKSETYLD